MDTHENCTGHSHSHSHQHSQAQGAGAPMAPTKLDPYGLKEVLIQWQDGSKYALTYPDLRFECPCANCVDEFTGKRVLKRESISADIKPIDMRVVGRYAIQVNWNDGHRTGMYSFERLHEICEATGRRIEL